MRLADGCGDTPTRRSAATHDCAQAVGASWWTTSTAKSHTRWATMVVGRLSVSPRSALQQKPAPRHASTSAGDPTGAWPERIDQRADDRGGQPPHPACERTLHRAAPHNLFADHDHRKRYQRGDRPAVTERLIQPGDIAEQRGERRRDRPEQRRRAERHDQACDDAERPQPCVRAVPDDRTSFQCQHHRRQDHGAQAKRSPDPVDVLDSHAPSAHSSTIATAVRSCLAGDSTIGSPAGVTMCPRDGASPRAGVR